MKMKLSCQHCGQVREGELFAYERVTPIEEDLHEDDTRLVRTSAIPSKAATYTCARCAPHPAQDVSLDEKQEKTTGNPYRFVRFRFDFGSKSYSDSWEPTESGDPTTEDPNVWLHAQREKYENFVGSESVLQYRYTARGHLPWLMLSDRNTSHKIEFETHDVQRTHHSSNLSTLGEDVNEEDADNIGTSSPLCDTRQGGITRRGFERIAEGKRWSAIRKSALRAIFFANAPVKTVAHHSGFKESTLKSYVHDLKAELDIVGREEKPTTAQESGKQCRWCRKFFDVEEGAAWAVIGREVHDFADHRFPYKVCRSKPTIKRGRIAIAVDAMETVTF